MAFESFKKKAQEIAAQVAGDTSEALKTLAEKAEPATQKAAEGLAKAGTATGQKLSEWSDQAGPTAAKAQEQLKKAGSATAEGLSKAADKASETANKTAAAAADETPAPEAVTEVKVERADEPKP